MITTKKAVNKRSHGTIHMTAKVVSLCVYAHVSLWCMEKRTVCACQQVFAPQYLCLNSTAAICPIFSKERHASLEKSRTKLKNNNPLFRPGQMPYLVMLTKGKHNLMCPPCDSDLLQNITGSSPTLVTPFH